MEQVLAAKVPLLSKPERETRRDILDEIVVHVDGSSSMRGFVVDNSEFSRVVAGIGSVAESLRPTHKVSVESIGETIESLGDQEVLDRLATDRDFFTQRESLLATALQGIDDARAGGIARCHVVLTDGLQYSQEEGLCDKGMDPNCLGVQFRRLIRKGWGVHVFAVRSHFNGKIYWHDDRQRFQSESVASRRGHPETYRPFLLLVLVNRTDEGEISPLLGVVRAIRDFLHSEIDRDLVRELHLSAPLVSLDEFEIETEGWKTRDGRRPNPARVVDTRDKRWEGPGGGLLPLWLHRVQVEHRRPKLAHRTPFLLRLTARVMPTDQGSSMISAAELSDLAREIRLVEVEPVAESADDASEDSELVEESEASSSKRKERGKPCKPKQLQFPSIGSEPPGQFVYMGEDDSPNRTGTDTSDSGERSAKIETFVHLSWSEYGDYPPIKVLRTDFPEDVSTTVKLPAWISEWSVSRADWPAAVEQQDASRLLDLEQALKLLASDRLVGRVVVEPQYIVLEPCARDECIK